MRYALMFVVLVAVGMLVAMDPSALPPDAAMITPDNPAGETVTPHHQDRGIGPVKELKLEPIDPKLVEEGDRIFGNECAMCHELDTPMVGPALRDVARRRSPEFIMNFLLNTVVMEKRDPAARKMVKEYRMAMPKEFLTREQARALLEYFRDVMGKTPQH